MIAKKRDIRLVLDNIRSVHNVGSIFRTADTLGISRIYCIGTTPTPLDRFKNKRKDFAKVSLGAEETVAWELVSEATTLLEKLKQEGFEIIALEQAENSADYKDVEVGDKAVIILGNEVEGVSKEILKMADVIAEIPLAGHKESLNVSVSAGIFLYRILDR
ncbi:MAG: TrmH family RNA methyltransferase [Patescibacteria group bacterium]